MDVPFLVFYFYFNLSLEPTLYHTLFLTLYSILTHLPVDIFFTSVEQKWINHNSMFILYSDIFIFSLQLTL